MKNPRGSANKRKVGVTCKSVGDGVGEEYSLVWKGGTECGAQVGKSGFTRTASTGVGNDPTLGQAARDAGTAVGSPVAGITAGIPPDKREHAVRNKSKMENA